MDERRDKIKDLEVKDDEAREVAGGKRRAKKSPRARKAGASAQNLTEQVSLNKR